jgi:hypothetical protein
MTDQSSTTTAMLPWSSPLQNVQHGTGEASLSRPARSLADAARAFRDASGAQHDPDDLARAFAQVDAALEDLAAAAQLAADATMEGSKRRGADAPDALPLATARALSSRLHGLRAELLGARRISSALISAFDGAVRR